MIRFSAVLPEATVNYVTNPALRYDTTGWNAQGATLTRVLSPARFGIASLRAVTAGAALREGAYFRVSALTGVKESITVSAYVRGDGRVRIRLDNNVVGGTEFASQPVDLTSERWQRISVTGFSTGGNDLRLYVETDEGTAKVRTFYIDGAQLERKAYATTYCDGEQDGCRWNGLFHGSTSSRAAGSRAGGRWYQLAGEEREQEDLYMTVVSGLGAMPITNTLQSFALEPGAFFANTKVGPRAIALAFHAKHKVDDVETPVSLAHLHALRQTLIDVVKPDRTGGNQSILFEYDDGTRPIYFRARYDGGLEGDWDIRNQFVNSFPLRLVAESPFVLEDSQEALELDFQERLFNANRAAARLDGIWSNMNYGVSDLINRLAVGPRGEIYAVGTFLKANNDAAAIDPLITPNGVAYWDGTKWNRLGSGFNVVGTPVDIAVAPNGYVYVAGAFTTIGGVAANRVAYWDGSAWNAMGTGLNGSAYSIKIAPNGNVYVGGTFTTAGGVTVNYIARWDGSQWKRLGQYGGFNTNGYVRDIEISQDGNTLYAAGDFTDQAGLSASALLRVASYDTTTGLFAAMGSGLNAQVNAIKLAPSGLVYAAGAFTASGSTTINGAAVWNGSTWMTLSTGCDGTVDDIQVQADGTVLFIGSFANAGGNPARGLALWNGSSFVNMDIYFAFSTYALHGGATLPNGDLYIGGEFFSAGTILVPGRTTVTNPGTSSVKPVIYVRGPGTLRWIENQTSGKRLYLNMILLNAEEVFFDFAKGEIYSTVRGSLLYAVLSGSDTRAFELLPGDNTLACLMTNDVGALMSIQYTPRHWSVDATALPES